MTTNEWGMLRDIFTEIAGEQKTAADVLSPPFTATGQARRAAHYTVADAFRRAAETMTARGGMTPDELTAAVREVFPRPTKDV